MESIFFHEGILAPLAAAATSGEKLRVIHTALRRRCKDIDRVAVALHDPKAGIFKTFVASPPETSPLRHYETSIQMAPSLQDTGATSHPRVINDLSVFAAGQHEHTRRIRDAGFASSYTFPVHSQQHLLGFIFFNSCRKNVFVGTTLDDMEIFSHLIANVLLNELAAVNALVAALKTTISMVHYRDPETGNHLDRVASFSRLIAGQLVEQGHCPGDDEWIEWISRFAPLHDIGKIAIPDRILFKPEKLDDREWAVMETHSQVGRKMVDDLIENFELGHLPHIEALRNIVEYHHEKLDGSGYPSGIDGHNIPVEARIVSVSDIFDALTSSRPYKESWSNQEALAELHRMAVEKIDRLCVDILGDNLEVVESIQERFKDDNILA